jgi:hypothetical protein
MIFLSLLYVISLAGRLQDAVRRRRFSQIFHILANLSNSAEYNNQPCVRISLIILSSHDTCTFHDLLIFPYFTWVLGRRASPKLNNIFWPAPKYPLIKRFSCFLHYRPILPLRGKSTKFWCQHRLSLVRSMNFHASNYFGPMVFLPESTMSDLHRLPINHLQN